MLCAKKISEIGYSLLKLFKIKLVTCFLRHTSVFNLGLL